jgi:hypothetical protein
MLRIEVIAEGKGVEGLQPPMIGIPAFIAASNFLHGNLR